MRMIRYQLNREDETDNIIWSIIRIHGHYTNNILVRLRALYVQDYFAYSAPPFSGRMGVGVPLVPTHAHKSAHKAIRTTPETET